MNRATPSISPAPALPAEPAWFVEEFEELRRQSEAAGRSLPLQWEQRQPQLDDRTPGLGFDRHYIYHTAWAARLLARNRPRRHIDISSTLYFCAIASAFVPVDYFEYRPVNLTLGNLTTGVADLQHLSFANQSVESLSCMHVVEHVGLGRYGDPIDVNADLEAMSELARVLAPGGSLFLVTPVGRPRVVFNAHRIYAPADIRDALAELELAEFSLIPDGRHKGGLMLNPPDEFALAQNYGCGCFHFRRSAE